jgi:hypothetical protein
MVVIQVIMQAVFQVFAATAAATPAETVVHPLPADQPTPTPATVCAPQVLTIRDLDHLEEVVESDNLLHARTKVLVRSRNNALWLAFGGLVAGTALMIAGLTVYADVDCYSIPFGDVWGCMTRPSLGALAGGAAIAVLGLVGAVALDPPRHDQIDVVNDWNARHPDRPIALRPRRP